MITKKREKNKQIKMILWIWIILMVSCYLELPALNMSAGTTPESRPAVSEQKSKSTGLAESSKSTEPTDITKPPKSDQTQSVKAIQPQLGGSVQSSEATTADYTNEDKNKGADIPMVVSDAAEKPEPDYLCCNANRGGAANRKEIDVLIHLINAEAYGLSYKSKVAVGQVVMNRWVGPYYGDDLLAIMTAPHQFTPIYNGSAYKKEIEPDSVKAAYAVLNGTGVDELTDDTYYFVNPDFTEDKTIEQKMTFVCEIEGIHFFKPPVK